MDQASGLLALQDRGPGLALLPGAARCFCAIIKKKLFNKWVSSVCVVLTKRLDACFFFVQAVSVEP